VHVGDLKASGEPCSDALLGRRFGLLDRLALPWLFTPGDNDWTDCHADRAGRFNPVERLQFLRRLFFGRADRSHGATPLPLRSQAAEPGNATFVENAMFELDGVLFATIHLVGSDNGMRPWRDIDIDDRAAAPRPERIAEVRAREAAARAWLDTAFDRAAATQARAVVLIFHVNPAMERSPEHPRRRPFSAFLERLHERAAAFARPVLLAHGDLHWYFVDRPFADLPQVVRVQVPGSPVVGWVRVHVAGPDAAGEPFRIEQGPATAHEPP
jgi:hypothetical protein